MIATIDTPHTLLTGPPGLIKLNNEGIALTVLQNCGPFGIWIKRDTLIGFADEMAAQDKLEKLDRKFVSAMTNQINISAVSENKSARWTDAAKSEHIDNLANFNVPSEYKARYKQLLMKHFQVISVDKNDLGRVKDFFHKIHMKDNEPVYRKQFKIPDAHRPFLEESLAEWLKLGVVQKSDSLYNSPVFCVPKKGGNGLRIVQDFRELNQKSYMDKYTMKDIHECIGDIGKAQ